MCIRDSSGAVRDCDTVFRLGGDEFGVLVVNVSIEQALSIFERLVSRFEAFKFYWEGQVFNLGASVGLVGIGDADIDVSELLSRADVACFAAKDAGRGVVHVYRPEVSSHSMQHKQLLMAAGLQQSITDNRFKLYCQPIAPVESGALNTAGATHYEILLRLSSDDGQLIFPGAFIPAAERYRLMGEIDRWVISNTFKQLFDRKHLGRDITITINLSGQSFVDQTLASFVKAKFGIYGVNPKHICFEITETAAISNLDTARSFISEMKQIGCTFALDDFGSGLSSFSYLKHLDVDYLKIDGSFIRDVATDRTDQIMVESINQIGKSLGLCTIAEFVENQEAVDILEKIGVDLLQGYYVGEPKPFAELFR